MKNIQKLITTMVAVIATLPMITQAHGVWPVSGRVTQNYWSNGSDHKAVDIACSIGTAVGCTSSGTTSLVRTLIDSSGNYYSYGKYVMVNHGSGYESLYAHLNSFATQAGEPESHSETLAYSGATGNVTGPHLHFEIRRYGTRLEIPATVGTTVPKGYPCAHFTGLP